MPVALPPAAEFGEPLPVEPAPEVLRFLARRRSASAVTLRAPGPTAEAERRRARKRRTSGAGATGMGSPNSAAGGRATGKGASFKKAEGGASLWVRPRATQDERATWPTSPAG